MSRAETMNTPLGKDKYSATKASQTAQRYAEFCAQADDLIAGNAANGSLATLLLLEISNLRQINRRHGFATGDQIIVAMRDTLSHYLVGGSCVSRIGGQTFAVLMFGSSTPAIIATTALELKEALDNALDFNAGHLPPTIRLAAAMAPTEQASARALLDMGERNLASSFAADGSDIEQMLGQQHRLTDDLLEAPFAQALKSRALRCHYQPQVLAHNGELVSAEALLRWHHPAHGWIRPERIVELAAQSGRCLDIVQHVIEQSFAFTASRRDAAETPRISVNLSPEVLSHPNLITCIDDCAQRVGLAPEHVTLEVTEQALVADIDNGSPVLRALRSRGYGLSIDDFGRGYSSLAYLRDIPATELKIDRIFIARALRTKRDRKLLCMIVDMAHLYGMTTIAEGIEQPEAQAIAIAAGCDLLQGWHIGKPMSDDTFSRWQSNWNGWNSTSTADFHEVFWR